MAAPSCEARRSARGAQTGAITVIQRFNSALDVSPHFHTLFADGVFVLPPHGPPEFIPVSSPRDEDIAEIASVVYRKVERKLAPLGCDQGARSGGADSPLLLALTAGLLWVSSRRGRVADATESGYEGHGVYGRDAVIRRYTGVWVDPMQRAMVRSEGVWDHASRTLCYDTRASDGRTSYRYQETFQRIDDGSELYRNVMTLADGRELEMVRSVYRRRG